MKEGGNQQQERAGRLGDQIAGVWAKESEVVGDWVCEEATPDRDAHAFELSLNGTHGPPQGCPHGPGRSPHGRTRHPVPCESRSTAAPWSTARPRKDANSKRPDAKRSYTARHRERAKKH